MRRILVVMAVVMMMCAVGLGAWGRFNEKADEPIPCGGKTPFKYWTDRHDALVKLAQKGDIDVAFFGDSLTDFWATDGKKVWEKEYAPLKAANFGIGGDQTQYVIYRMANGELDGMKPKVVVLEIGTNNMAVSHHTPAETVIGIKGVVKLVREKLPESKILLLAVFPQGQTAKDPSRVDIDAVNKEIAKLDDGKMVTYLDFNAKFLDAEGNKLNDLRLGDGAHLSEKGFQVWADAMRETLAKLMAGMPQTQPAK